MSIVSINQAGAANNQALRTALALSLLTGIGVDFEGLKDDNPRPRPGLGKASLNLLAAVARSCQGQFQGVVGEERASFTPGVFQYTDYTLSLSALRFSEAPLSWLLETMVPALCALEQPVSILASGGGTHVFGGPTSEEVNQLILPLWSRMGLAVDFLEIAPGFHPNASGEVEISISPSKHKKPLELTAAFKPVRLGVDAVIADLPVYLAEQAMEAVASRLSRYGFQTETSLRQPMSGHGQGLLVWADNGQWRVGFSIMGRKGARLDTLAGQAVEELLSFLKSGASLPAHQALYCLLPAILAPAHSRILVDKVDSALKAAIRVLDKFYPETVSLAGTGTGAILHIKGRPPTRA